MICITWNQTAYWFNLKKAKPCELDKLSEQIKKLLDEHHQLVDAEARKTLRVALRKRALLAAIDASLPLIDDSFDILMELHAKHVNWQNLEGYTKALASGADVKGEMLPPLELDDFKAIAAIQIQSQKTHPKEAFAIIKAIHDYFAGLTDEVDIADVAPNLEDGCIMVLSYLILNDLMLARIVGEQDSQKEVAYFEDVIVGFSS